MAGQREGAAIAMTDDERHAFPRTQPACRVATVGPGGHPHASALWCVGDGTALAPEKIVSWDFAKLRGGR
jgi:hypothetical protein